MPASFTSGLAALQHHALAAAADAVEQTGRQVAQDARARARVDEGDMAAGIEWQPGEDGLAGAVVARDWKTLFHEFGTKRKAAQPMLVPAAEAARQEFERKIKDAFE